LKRNPGCWIICRAWSRRFSFS